MEVKPYGLPTAIAMIVGIVIGSGIFFKSDNILTATGGSVPLGIALFTLAALGIVFGSLTIAQLAGDNDDTGGVIAYFEKAYSPRAACAFGWFQVFIYYPALTAIIGWVFGIYICDFFSLGSNLLNQCLVGMIAIILIFCLNIVAVKIGGYLQNVATVIKLLPLVLIAVAGWLYGDGNALSDASGHISPASASWLSAVGPVAFSFDGWIIATAISHELKDAKRSLPLALIIAPIIILAVYIAYFVGISALLGADTIMALGDGHVALATRKLFGDMGGRIIMIFVIISVLGTLNGIILGGIRLPYALAQRNMLPHSSYFLQLNDAFVIPLRSAILTLLISTGWLILHFAIEHFHLLPNSDISEMFIIISYALYIALYIRVIFLWHNQHITHPFLGLAAPLLAIIGSLFILYCGLQTPYFLIGVLVSTFVMTAAYHYR